MHASPCTPRVELLLAPTQRSCAGLCIILLIIFLKMRHIIIKYCIIVISPHWMGSAEGRALCFGDVQTGFQFFFCSHSAHTRYSFPNFLSRWPTFMGAWTSHRLLAFAAVALYWGSWKEPRRHVNKCKQKCSADFILSPPSSHSCTAEFECQDLNVLYV